VRSSAKCRPSESSYVSSDDCFAALQLILSLFTGGGHAGLPAVALAKAGRVTLPLRRPWRGVARLFILRSFLSSVLTAKARSATAVALAKEESEGG